MVSYSIRAASASVACIGLVAWTYYAFEGFFRVNPAYWSPETDWSVLIYKTYFCTPGEFIHRYQIKLFCIFQLFLYNILLVGSSKVDRLPLFLFCTLMGILQLKRIHRLVYSGCSWNYRLILHLIYASLEIWIVLLFIMQKKRKTQFSSEQSLTQPTQLNPQQLQSNAYGNRNWQTIWDFVAPVASAPTLTNTNSINNTSPPNIERVSSVTADLPPTYNDSVRTADHRSINVDSTEGIPSNVSLILDTPTDLPPNYEDCVTPNPQMNPHR